MEESSGRKKVQCLSLLLIFLYMSTLNYAQVKIKEKLEISPKVMSSIGTVPLNQMSSLHTILCEMTWIPNSEAAYTIHMLREPDGVSSTQGVRSSNGYNFLRFDSAKAGYYCFQIVSNKPYVLPPFQVKVTADGKTVAANCYLSGSNPWNDYWNYEFSYSPPPMFSDFELALFTNPLRWGYGTWALSLSPTSDGREIWDPYNDEITFIVKEGNDIASFYNWWNYTGNVGKSFSFKLFGTGPQYSDNHTFLLDYYKLGVDDYYYGKVERPLIVEATVKGITHSISALLYPSPPKTMEVKPDGWVGTTVMHGKEFPLRLNFISQRDRYYVPLPDTTKVFATIIKGQSLGSLKDVSSGRTGKIQVQLDHQYDECYINFLADGDIPKDIDTALIRFTCTDPDIKPVEYSLPVIPGEVKITFVPETVFPGDTALIKLEKWNSYYGYYEPFKSAQQFELGIMEGCSYAEILKPDGTKALYVNGNYDLLKPMRLVVIDSLGSSSDSLHIDSVSVALMAGIPDVYSSPSMKKKPAEGQMANSSSPKEKPRMQSCSSPINSPYFGVQTLTVQNPELVIISPTKSINDTISAEPAMPKVICKAQLKKYKGGQINYEWEYWISYDFPRYKYVKNKQTGKLVKVFLCPRTGKSLFKGQSTANNDEITQWPVSFDKTVGQFWFKARYYKQVKDQPWGCDEEINAWIDGSDVFTGGYVYLKVTAKSPDGKILAKYQGNANLITGCNPALNDIYQCYLMNNQIKAILTQESKSLQFSKSYKNEYNKMGFPIYGYPSGFGLMQLDNPPLSELQLWNWRENLRGGVEHFNQNLKEAEKYLVQHDYTTKQLMIDAFQRYNSGKAYWKWDDINESWYRSPEVKILKNHSKPYGEEVYDIFINL